MAFSETISMESGMFAYFDPENQEYVAWNESVGSASGSPDGNPLTYNHWIYTATDDERRHRAACSDVLNTSIYSPYHQRHRCAGCLGTSNPDLPETEK